MSNKILVLDAGHSLVTSGKQTASNLGNVYKEWELNNAVVKNVVSILKDYNVTIYRTDDTSGNTDVPLSDRVARCNKYNPHLFVSVHHNAGGGTGTEVYWHTYGTQEDKKVANIIAPKLANELNCRNRGVKQASFAVLGCKATAVLIEGGFMDTKADYDVMITSKGQQSYAKAIADSVIEYLGLKKIVIEQPKVTYRVRKTWADASSQKGAYSELNNAKVECNKHSGYSVYDENGKAVYTNAPQQTASVFKEYKVKIVCDTLTIREKADFNSKAVGTVKRNDVYTIIGESNGLLRLKSGAGWISANSKYVAKV